MSLSVFVPPTHTNPVAQYLPRNLSNIDEKSAAKLVKELQKMRLQTGRKSSAILKPSIKRQSRERRNSFDLLDRKTVPVRRLQTSNNKPTRRKSTPARQQSYSSPGASSEEEEEQCICEQQKTSLTKFCPKCIKMMMKSVLPTNANNYTEEKPVPEEKETEGAAVEAETEKTTEGDNEHISLPVSRSSASSSVSDASLDSGIPISPLQMTTDFYIETFSGETILTGVEEYPYGACSLERDGEKCACTECLQKDLTNAFAELDKLPKDEYQEYTPRLRKVSSLKSTKTPPGERSKKKVVRFADAFGFDLQTVRPIFNKDAPPVIPISATSDLKLPGDSHAAYQDEFASVYQPMEPEFVTELLPSFSVNKDLVKLWQQRVLLQDVKVDGLVVTGTIKVANLAFEKRVILRYSADKWEHHVDVNASYVVQSHDDLTDLFSFSLFAPATFKPGDQLSFAICYHVNGQQYWDNNDGKNYNFRGISKTVFRRLDQGSANYY